ncbi:hypothetical protein ACLKMH_14460 [Psychromonas sp. KJ10-10]|uniref:hypothetical protein n=1 Tax=Psychromonas sp. KJ10-10 TaxID=3391823 RepID=UPI0039B397BF
MAVFIALMIIVFSALHGEQFMTNISLFLAFFIAPFLMELTKGKSVVKNIIIIGIIGE